MNLMSWQFVLFTKITALKMSIKSVTVAFIVSDHSLKYACVSKGKTLIFGEVPCFICM